jgi:phospholipase/carboxylesterase
VKEFTKRDASYQYLKIYICKMDLQFIVREPENITPNSQLLVMIHGYGSNEEDLFSFRHDLPKDWIIVSFRAPRNSDYEGFAWYDIDFNNPDKFLDVDQAVDSMKLIMKSIDNLKHHYQLESKTNIVGFSQGGVLTYAMTLTYPDYFHKVACLSSYPDPKILKNIKGKKEIQHLRFFVSHGSEDAVIPLDWGRKAADFLYELGAFFTFREYMTGHSVNQKNYIDLIHFFEK